MKYAASKISQTALIALLYFLGARLGTLLRVPPGIASAIWPAAGIAGAFVFIIGPFATLGITIGALCSAIVNQNGAPWHWFSLVTALAAAGHGALFFQLRRRLIIQNDFDDSESILNFIKIAALSSVGSATIGTAGLHYAGFSTSLTFDWATWWFGDAIGTILFTPMTLLFIGPASIWRSRRISMLTACGTTLALFVGLLAYTNAREDESTKLELDLKISQSLNTVNDTFRYARNTLMMIKSIHQSTEGNSYEIFRILASSAKQTNPSILAVEWAPKIAEADVATFEQRMSLELGQPYRIFEKDSQGTAVPVTRRAEYYPVAYVEPLAGNEKALGYDLNSETERSQAIHAAIDTQLPATTNPIKLVQDPNSQYGGLLYFAPQTTGNMLLKRQEAPELFMAVIDLNVLFSPLTLLKDSLGINFVVQSTATSKTLATSLPKNTPIDLANLAKSTTNISKTITIADRSWTFQFYAPRDTSSHSIMNWMILGLALLLSAGTVSGILLITGNVHRTNALITERTNELSSTRDEALRAGSAKSDFLATMSHEIRTPMNGIIGMTETLAESDLNAEQRTAVNVIQESGAALLSLLNNILDMSKIESGKIELSNVPFSPSKLIKAVKGLFAPIARSENTKLDVNIDASVPEVVTGDDLRLRQILINIVSNALKFAAGATVTISMRAVEQPGFVKLLIDVNDTGEGMSPTQVSRIFQKFTQAEAGTTRRHGGSGLGLTIAQNLATLMSGSITVDSELGKGTTFHIEVVVGSHHQPDLQVAKSKDLPIAEGSATIDFGDLSILVAEDNKTNQIVIRQFLAKVNVTASFADNGRIAVEMARERNWAVVFMDLHMPELNGQDATREIRGLKDSIQQPWIVALTADAFDGTRQECYDAGMNDFITKPVTRKTIVDALEKYKSNRSSLKS